jgi:hypothetical protein
MVMFPLLVLFTTGGVGLHAKRDEGPPFPQNRCPPLCEVAMCQNLMILARFGDLRNQLDLGALPPLVLRCSSGHSN